jgi:hypothetical protein
MKLSITYTGQREGGENVKGRREGDEKCEIHAASE